MTERDAADNRNHDEIQAQAEHVICTICHLPHWMTFPGPVCWSCRRAAEIRRIAQEPNPRD